MKEDESKKKLINEKIVGRKFTFKRALKSFIVAAVCGLLFGGLAGLSFTAVSRMRAAAAESQTAQTESQPVPETGPESPESAESIPGETEEASAENTAAEESSEVSAAETGSGDAETEVAGEDPETQEEDAGPAGSAEASETEEADTTEDPEGTEADGGADMENDSLSEEGTGGNVAAGESENTDAGDGTSEEDGPGYAETLIALQKKVVEMTRPYIVTVSAITTGSTWFESPVESTQSFAGIILDVTEEEILILTTAGPTNAETLRVTFFEGPTADAYVKQFSVRDDLAVLAVPFAEEVSEELLSAFRGIMLSDSYDADVGDPVVAVGAPLGVVNSCAFGSIGFVSTDEPALDMAQRILYADIRVDAEKGSFILNRGGELLGIAGKRGEKSGLDNDLARIITIGSVKDILDRMEAGEKQAYIGLEGFGVSGEMISDDIAGGMYITNVYTDSPAYTAGIKRGDIVTMINESPVRDAYEYAAVMRTLRPEEMITLVIRRGSADGNYRSINFMLTTGER